MECARRLNADGCHAYSPGCHSNRSRVSFACCIGMTSNLFCCPWYIHPNTCVPTAVHLHTFICMQVKRKSQHDHTLSTAHLLLAKCLHLLVTKAQCCPCMLNCIRRPHLMGLHDLVAKLVGIISTLTAASLTSTQWHLELENVSLYC